MCLISSLQYNVTIVSWHTVPSFIFFMKKKIEWPNYFGHVIFVPLKII